MIKIFAAPLQGLTDAIWRNTHHDIFGGVDTYYTPFVRIERGDFRNRDIRDITPENNNVPNLVPQILAGNPDEMSRIIELFLSLGYGEADLNLGCPHPPITGKHKGSGLLPYPDKVSALLVEMQRYPQMKFSVKMRLGLEDAGEWKDLIQILNESSLKHITVHPRIGKQQYRGETNRQAFAEFYEVCKHPIVYNGDIQSTEDINMLEADFPRLEGVMIGRGLLARPSLAMEYIENRTISQKELYDKVSEMHDCLLQSYCSQLQGDTQILSKLKPYWEYLLPDINKKAKKTIKKATRLDKYIEAVKLILSDY